MIIIFAIIFHFITVIICSHIITIIPIINSLYIMIAFTDRIIFLNILSVFINFASFSLFSIFCYSTLQYPLKHKLFLDVFQIIFHFNAFCFLLIQLYPFFLFQTSLHLPLLPRDYHFTYYFYFIFYYLMSFPHCSVCTLQYFSHIFRINKHFRKHVRNWMRRARTISGYFHLREVISLNIKNYFIIVINIKDIILMCSMFILIIITRTPPMIIGIVAVVCLFLYVCIAVSCIAVVAEYRLNYSFSI